MLKSNHYIFFVAVVLFLSVSQMLHGQQLLQLEIYNDPIAKKFGPGDVLIYQTKSLKEWQTDKIESVDYENQLVFFVNGYEHLDNFTKVKIYKKWVKQLGLKLMQFSAAWFLYGGIVEIIDDDFDFGWDTVGVGGGALITGYFLYKFASSKTYDVKGKDRLRIIDISWPEPRG